MRVHTTVAALAVCLLAAGSVAAEIEIHQKHRFDARPGATVVVDVSFHSVEVTARPGNAVDVTVDITVKGSGSSAKNVANDLSPAFEEEGDRLIIRSTRKKGWSWKSASAKGKVTVQMPPDMNLVIDSSSGSAEITGDFGGAGPKHLPERVEILRVRGEAALLPGVPELLEHLVEVVRGDRFPRGGFRADEIPPGVPRESPLLQIPNHPDPEVRIGKEPALQGVEPELVQGVRQFPLPQPLDHPLQDLALVLGLGPSDPLEKEVILALQLDEVLLDSVQGILDIYHFRRSLFPGKPGTLTYGKTLAIVPFRREGGPWRRSLRSFLQRAWGRG